MLNEQIVQAHEERSAPALGIGDEREFHLLKACSTLPMALRHTQCGIDR